MTIFVMVPSLLYVVASVELNGKRKIKTKTLNVKELNGKYKKERGKHNSFSKKLSFQNPKLVISKKNPSTWQMLTRGCLLVPIGVTNRD